MLTRLGSFFSFLNISDSNLLSFSAIKREEKFKFKKRGVIFVFKINIHYHRYDFDYKNWNLYLWTDAESINIDKSLESDFGRVYEVDLLNVPNKLGFCINRNNWSEKEIYDRYVDLSMVKDNHIDVYVMQGEVQIAYREEDIDKSAKILRATFVDSENFEIRVETNKIFETLRKEDFKVLDQENKEIAIKDVYAEGVLTCIVVLDEKIDPFSRTYTIEVDGYSKKTVSLFNLFSRKEFSEMFGYDGSLGCFWSKEFTSFKLWAPTATGVKVAIYQDCKIKEPLVEISMIKKEKGLWEAEVLGNMKDKFYTYIVDVEDQTNEAVDPFANAVGVNGTRGMIIDINETNPDGWSKDKIPHLENIEDSIIYEAHVRDLTSRDSSGVKNKGKYIGLTEENSKNAFGQSTALSHLKELGITHLHLLPIFDYIGVEEENGLDYQWGYNPNNYNAPCGSYATNPYDGKVRIRELKKMIQSLHENGIRVVMDVVYNHTFRTNDSNFNLIVPGYFYRHNCFGGYSNGSGCGNELASELPMVRRFIVESVLFWLKEYHLDGFRFDLMALHDINTMNLIREEVDKMKKNVLLYGEGWTAEWSPLSEANRASKWNNHKLNNVGFFSDDARDIIKGGTFERSDKGFANGASHKEYGIHGVVKAAFVNQPGQQINYVSVHDNYCLWDKINFTNGWENIQERKKIHMLANAILLTSQGIPLIQEGDEFCRTKNGEHNSYNLGDEINGIDWNRKDEFYDVFEFMKKLIHLRKKYNLFRMRTREEVDRRIKFLNVPSANMVCFEISGDEQNPSLVVIYNANYERKTLSLTKEPSGIIFDFNEEAKISGNQVDVPGRSCTILEI
jgi:pullulanase